jgi:UrcA family protein
MKLHHSGRRLTRHALLTLGAVVAVGAFAADALDEVTVTGTRIGKAAAISKVVGRSASTGAPIEHLTLTWSVPFVDLDLSTQSGAAELEKRVDARARAVCEELDKLFPLTTPSPGSPDCVKAAVAGAKPQVNRVIAAAKKAQEGPKPK